MKKVSILLMAVIAISFASCAQQGPKANLKTNVDSLSYATGLSRTQMLKQYLLQSGVDTIYMDDFMKGFHVGAKGIEEADRAYAQGIQIGQMVSKYWVEGLNQQVFGADTTQTVSRDNMIAGFVAGVTGKNMLMGMAESDAYQQEAIDKIKKAAEMKARKEGEDFLAANKTKPGVVTTASGLQYKVITEGKGETPAETSEVKVNYKGTLIDGTEFDSSEKHGGPASFRVDGVIKGWTEALQLMPVGSKWQLFVPQELAYGTRGSGPTIKPYSALVFEVELLEIVKK